MLGKGCKRGSWSGEGEEESEGRCEGLEGRRFGPRCEGRRAKRRRWVSLVKEGRDGREVEVRREMEINERSVGINLNDKTSSQSTVAHPSSSLAESRRSFERVNESHPVRSIRVWVSSDLEG